jgi:hypothetical protein
VVRIFDFLNAVANGLVDTQYGSLKCEYTVNEPKYGLETLFTDIRPYKSGHISKIGPFFMILTHFMVKSSCQWASKYSICQFEVRIHCQ